MLQTVLLQVLCVGVAVWLTHVITPMIDRVISMTWSRIALWPLLWRRGEHRAPSGTEPFDLYQAGDPYLNWRWGKPFWDGARIHLVTAAALASIAPLLPLGHNPFGLAGMIVLIPLFGHMGRGMDRPRPVQHGPVGDGQDPDEEGSVADGSGDHRCHVRSAVAVPRLRRLTRSWGVQLDLAVASSYLQVDSSCK